MSEELPAPLESGEGSAGSLLRQAREAAGLHIAALAVSLKVPVRKLEALEAGRLDQLPDAVFVRGLAASVCRSLKIDPGPVLARLPQTATPRLTHDEPGINAPFRGSGDGPGPSWLDQLRKPVVLAVLLLLLGALVLAFLPNPIADAISETAAEAGGATSSVPTAANPVASGGRTAGNSGEFATLAVSPGTPRGFTVAMAPPATAQPSVAPVPVAQFAAPASVASPAAASASGAAAGIVIFRATGPSWIEVVDAKGQVPLRRLLTQGEAAGAAGALPLSVTVGRADVTQVQVRGKSFDLSPVSRENVARFEVR